jgi:hypothetical protein
VNAGRSQSTLRRFWNIITVIGLAMVLMLMLPGRSLYNLHDVFTGIILT